MQQSWSTAKVTIFPCLISIGGDLKTYSKAEGGKKEKLETYMDLFYQLCSGLFYIHEKKQLHRDIKPENVFVHLAEHGKLVAKLGDFGILKDRKELLESLATSGVGTTLYMSPERCNCEKYWMPSDVWAMGLILFEMLSGGETALDYKSNLEIWNSIVNCKLRPLPDYVDKRLDTFVRLLLRHNPDDRPTIE